ncbi:hypothetical protein J1G43_18205 [Cellulomonas sp. zg-ZUI22]|uniref:hypothetical protein n=1 Tax=Cellulomonas sp. zg-ZUI22 TaxID=2816955 RepID=UPI001A9531F5|nr:hypothetical protein [Cellulomonas sp. zg-ZUI22]MBO0901898.1 hypothetical protein [Cellulomonas sp. zg-ZUI22]
MTATTEYDRFGPWIDEVTTPDDVPRLYRDHPLDLDAARLVLKVPRNIARRDATADMDLYDHLLVVDATTLTVLSRRAAERARRGVPAVPAGYDVRTVPLTRVVVVQESVDLLDGRLTVRTDDGAALTVRFNGSARTQVTRLVDVLRAGAVVGAPTAVGRALDAAGRAAAPCPLDPGPEDLALVADVTAAVRANPGLVPWACHGRRRLTVRPTGALGLVRLAAHVLSPATVEGAVVAGDGSAVEVIGRSTWVTRGQTPQHSASRLVLPLSRLDTVALTPHPLYADATQVELTLGAAVATIVVPAGSAIESVVAAARAG